MTASSAATTTIVQAVEAQPRAGPADQVHAILKKHFDARDAKIAALKAQVEALRGEIKALKSSQSRPARLPKATLTLEPIAEPSGAPEPEPAAEADLAPVPPAAAPAPKRRKAAAAPKKI